MPNSRRFSLGTLVWTRGVNDLIAVDASFTKFVLQSISRHANGDWGNLGDADKQENEFSLKNDLRLLSSYEQGEYKIWIITEADRSATTILFPSEY